MNEKTKQIKAVMADEAFVKACIEAENEEAVQKLFADKGVEMSLTEIELMKEMVCAVGEGKITEEQLDKLANSGELTEDELEEAAGGNWFTELFKKDVLQQNVIKDVVFNGNTYPAFAPETIERVYSASKIAGGVAVGIVAAAGIAQACGVDVVGGIKSGCSWVADKVTSRW